MTESDFFVKTPCMYIFSIEHDVENQSFSHRESFWQSYVMHFSLNVRMRMQGMWCVQSEKLWQNISLMII